MSIVVGANRTTDMTLLTECEAFCASAVYKHGYPPGVKNRIHTKTEPLLGGPLSHPGNHVRIRQTDPSHFGHSLVLGIWDGIG